MTDDKAQLFVLLYTYIKLCIYLCVYNFYVKLWRLTSPKIFIQQTRDPGEPVV